MALQRYAYLGQSIKYPLVINEFGRPELSRGLDNIKESILEILSTPLGTRLMLPEYGSRVFEQLFEPNDDVLVALLENDIVEALEIWEKRIEVERVDFEFAAEHVVNCLIRFRVLASNSVDSFVFPFYRKIEN